MTIVFLSIYKMFHFGSCFFFCLFVLFSDVLYCCVLSIATMPCGIAMLPLCARWEISYDEWTDPNRIIAYICIYLYRASLELMMLPSQYIIWKKAIGIYWYVTNNYFLFFLESEKYSSFEEIILKIFFVSS